MKPPSNGPNVKGSAHFGRNACHISSSLIKAPQRRCPARRGGQPGCGLIAQGGARMTPQKTLARLAAAALGVRRPASAYAEDPVDKACSCTRRLISQANAFMISRMVRTWVRSRIPRWDFEVDSTTPIQVAWVY